MRALLDIYRAQFRITFATQLQYRAELLIWLIGMVLEPVIYLVVWSAVSRVNNDSVGGFGARDFAAYFIVTMMVNFITFDWHMWEFEFRIREGQFSPLLLRPVHPIHADMASNITYKTLMLAIMLPVSALLAYTFDANLHPDGRTMVLFLIALLLAFVMRSILEWSLALISFWTTRMLAVNRAYFSLSLFLSGKMAPISLLPAPLQFAAAYLPFRWMISFPAEVLLGRVAPEAALNGFLIQAGWIGASLILLNLMWRFGVRRYAGSAHDSLFPPVLGVCASRRAGRIAIPREFRGPVVRFGGEDRLGAGRPCSRLFAHRKSWAAGRSMNSTRSPACSSSSADLST